MDSDLKQKKVKSGTLGTHKGIQVKQQAKHGIQTKKTSKARHGIGLGTYNKAAHKDNREKAAVRVSRFN